MIYVGTQVVRMCLPHVVGAATVQNTCKSLLLHFSAIRFIGDIL